MQKLLLVTLCLAGMGLSAAARGAEATPAGAVWLDSLAAAESQARTANKPVLALFTGTDWCPWCVKLEQEVLGTKQFEDWAAKNVVLARLDFPRKPRQPEAVRKANAAAMAKYKVSGVPTVIFLSPEGAVLGRWSPRRQRQTS